MKVSAITQSYYAKPKVQKLSTNSQKPSNEVFHPSFRDVTGGVLGAGTGAAVASTAALFLLPGIGTLAFLGIYAAGLAVGGAAGHIVEEKT